MLKLEAAEKYIRELKESVAPEQYKKSIIASGTTA